MKNIVEKLKNKKNIKSGFSLAETMVVLVIVAILMAAAAPLVAKKMSNDSKRLISVSNDGKAVFVAAGDNQVLNVGSKSENLKLKVNGNTEMNGDLKIINKLTKDGSNINMIFKSDGIKTKNGSPENEKYLFKIDPASRETNIEIAIPDYKEMKEGTNYPVKVTDNGFVYVSNSLKGFKVQKTSISGATNSSALSKAAAGTVINLTAFQEQITLDGKTVNIATRLPLLIPVSEGSYFQCANGNFMIADGGNLKTINNSWLTESSAYYQNKCYFIPLAKAKTTTISEE